jgi:hypothetical protein
MTAQTLAGSIEAGQDPGYPGSLTTDQQQRSGQVPEAYLRYYHSTAGAARPTVGSIIDAAVADGVDVINMSLSTGGSSGNCNKNYNDGATNAAITNATNAGVILVASAGDGGSSSGCNIGYPSLRTEVLSVGELDSSNNANSYTQLPIHSESSRGGMAINSYGGILAGVALIAPGVFTNQYQTSGSSSLYASSTWHGTSFSAPAVAGMVGLMRNAWSSIGWQSSDARIMIANALLMGDGWNGTSTTSQGMNAVTGAGRPRMHWPTSTDLTAPWGWGQRSVSLTYAGQEVSWTVGDAAAEDSRITQWKWAIHYTWNGAGTGGLSDITDVDFFVDNTCAPGGIVTVASDIGYDNRARFRLSQADIAGKCLRMRVRAVSLPGGPVTVYSADYFHSGITGEH